MPTTKVAASLSWLATAAVLAFAGVIVTRSCGYAARDCLAYAAYFAAHVMLPGAVALRVFSGRSISLTALIALGIPTGYAVEIVGFLSCAAAGLKGFFPFMPLLWVAGAMWLTRHGRSPLMRCHLTARHAGLALAMGVLGFCTVIAAAAQMYAESPLVGGLPQRPIFHDWMYLVSRAVAIREHWPLQDPSLAGAPLQYHYFMLVHAAAASWATHSEMTTVLLRLAVVPLGAVLVTQAYALGRHVSRRAWGGVLAVLLSVAASEASFATHYAEPMFLGLFVRWLYLSPTFFFGHVFFGALLLAIAYAVEAPRLHGRNCAWLALLAAAATGAKGTVVPVVVAALGMWLCWDILFGRRHVRRLLALTAIALAPFLCVYWWAMSAWGTGSASWEPARVLELTRFWREFGAEWVARFGAWFPGGAGSALGQLLCALVVTLGSAGIRIVAIPYLFCPDRAHRVTAGRWLGAVLVAAWAMGMGLKLDSYGELYLVLLWRLPMAILAAAFLTSAWAEWKSYRARRRSLFVPGEPRFVRSWSTRGAWTGQVAPVICAIGLAITLALQVGLWAQRNRAGIFEWLRLTPELQLRDDMRPLYETMAWLRAHTESDAVVIANAFTLENMQEERGVAVDHTSAGLYYYYSALSGRRLWVEGPIYLRDPEHVRERMAAASAFFYREEDVSVFERFAATKYALIDNALGDGARVALPEACRVFSNGRFDVFKLPVPAPDHPRLAQKVAMTE